MGIAFNLEIDFAYGEVVQLTPLIRRVIANNPSPFTFTGTGTYIIGCGGGVAVIDPGPLLDSHIDAICAALTPDEHISHIVITHTHSDHSPGAKPLQAAMGGETYGFMPVPARQAASNSEIHLEEDADTQFTPDNPLNHGDIISGESWRLEAVHTPGHMSNHMCYALLDEAAFFSGDHVMGWSTSVIAPPDGNMADYMASLEVLLTRDEQVYYPTHGSPIENPHQFVRGLIAHRQAREAQILEQLRSGVHKIDAIVAILYRDVDARLHPAACLSVLAHMQDLVGRGIVQNADATAQIKSSYSASAE